MNQNVSITIFDVDRIIRPCCFILDSGIVLITTSIPIIAQTTIPPVLLSFDARTNYECAGLIIVGNVFLFSAYLNILIIIVAVKKQRKFICSFLTLPLRE